MRVNVAWILLTLGLGVPVVFILRAWLGGELDAVTGLVSLITLAAIGVFGRICMLHTVDLRPDGAGSEPPGLGPLENLAVFLVALMALLSGAGRSGMIRKVLAEFAIAVAFMLASGLALLAALQ